VVVSPFFAGLSDKVGCLVVDIVLCRVVLCFKVTVALCDICIFRLCQIKVWYLSAADFIWVCAFEFASCWVLLLGYFYLMYLRIVLVLDSSFFV